MFWIQRLEVDKFLKVKRVAQSFSERVMKQATLQSCCPELLDSRQLFRATEAV